MPLSDNDREWMVVTLRDGLDAMVSKFMVVCTSIQARIEGLEYRRDKKNG